MFYNCFCLYLMLCTDISNSKNGKKTNDRCEVVYDNASSSAYDESVDCEVSISEARQVSDYKCQLMSLISCRPQHQSLA